MKLTLDQATDVVSRIHIGNVRDKSTHIGKTIYCGRGMGNAGKHGSWEESVLHNPHSSHGMCKACKTPTQHITPSSTIPFYMHYLRTQVGLRRPAIMNELRRIWIMAAKEEITLLCWCAPGPCHTEVIQVVLLELAIGKL